MRITKRVDFCAAHSIKGAGKCENKHGHNWEAIIEVDFVGGEITRDDGFLADVREIKDAAFRYDHDDLDKYFEWPSTENVAQKIADDAIDICEKANPEALFIVHVHLIETKNNSADAVSANYELHSLNDAFDKEYSDDELKELEDRINARFVGLEGARNNEPEEVRKEGFRKDREAAT